MRRKSLSQMPHTYAAQHADLDRQSADLVRTLAGHNAQAQQPVVSRTRRAVRIADQTRREQGARGRRNIGIALFAVGSLLLLLGPAIWGSMDEFAGGEHFGDLSAQVLLISSFLTVAVAGALAVALHHRANRDDYQSDSEA